MEFTDISLIPILSAAVDADSSGMAKVIYQVTGFVIVLTVLTSLWAAISLIGSLFTRLNIQDPEAASPPTRPAAPAATPAAGLSTAHVAAIGAALHTVIKGPFQIVDIKEAPSDGSDKKA